MATFLASKSPTTLMPVAADEELPRTKGVPAKIFENSRSSGVVKLQGRGIVGYAEEGAFLCATPSSN